MHQQAADIFQKLAADLDTEGRYLFLNALANQLRFPNNHTHYFSCILLYLFDQNAKVHRPPVPSMTSTAVPTPELSLCMGPSPCMCYRS